MSWKSVSILTDGVDRILTPIDPSRDEIKQCFYKGKDLQLTPKTPSKPFSRQHSNFFTFIIKKISIDISCELFCLKCQDLFSMKIFCCCSCKWCFD